MGSTFWAESYFRSLKRTKVLPLLTKYLLQYKRVSIPHIGSFELVQEPPQLQVADHLFLPPSFTTAYIKRDGVPEHQSRFFSTLDASAGSDGLSLFGEQLHNRLRRGPVQWKGFGILRYSANEIVFEPQPLILPALQALPAQKILRQDAVHQVLVGDQSVSKQAVETDVPVRRQRRWAMTVAFVLLLLGLAAIIALLYQGRFLPQAAGMRLHWNF